MKALAISLIATCGLALSPKASAATFGDFTSGQTFTFTVQSVVSTQSVGTKTKKGVPIPSSLPTFKKGDKVKFTIGGSGQLKGPGFSIPFLSTTTYLNTYAKLPSLTSLSPNGASVAKKSTGAPVAASLVFYKYRLDGSSVNTLTINQVCYSLK